MEKASPALLISNHSIRYATKFLGNYHIKVAAVIVAISKRNAKRYHYLDFVGVIQSHQWQVTTLAFTHTSLIVQNGTRIPLLALSGKPCRNSCFEEYDEHPVSCHLGMGIPCGSRNQDQNQRAITKTYTVMCTERLKQFIFIAILEAHRKSTTILQPYWSNFVWALFIYWER